MDVVSNEVYTGQFPSTGTTKCLKLALDLITIHVAAFFSYLYSLSLMNGTTIVWQSDASFSGFLEICGTSPLQWHVATITCEVS